jgi:hypothetical protein
MKNSATIGSSIGLIAIIVLVLLLIFGVASCSKEKQPVLYMGNWYGLIIYDSSTINDTTLCRRIFSDTAVKWWDAPSTFANIVPIDYQSYCIRQVIMIDTSWCYNTMAIREFEFTGSGIIRGDTLYESGTLFYTVKANGITYNEKGKWSAKLTKTYQKSYENFSEKVPYCNDSILYGIINPNTNIMRGLKNLY